MMRTQEEVIYNWTLCDTKQGLEMTLSPHILSLLLQIDMQTLIARYSIYKGLTSGVYPRLGTIFDGIFSSVVVTNVKHLTLPPIFVKYHVLKISANLQ